MGSHCGTRCRCPYSCSLSATATSSSGAVASHSVTVMFDEPPILSPSRLPLDTLPSSVVDAHRHSFSSSTSQPSSYGEAPYYSRCAGADQPSTSSHQLPSYEPPRDSMDVVTISSGCSQGSVAPRPRFSSTVVVSKEERAGSVQQFWVLFRYPFW